VRVLVWQWGRYGAGPRFAAHLAAALDDLPGVGGLLSLAADAEILLGADPPRCDLPVRTYTGIAGLAGRVLRAPSLMAELGRELRALAADLAICAMPGPLDLLFLWALRRAGVPVAVIVHDAQRHPGDGFPLLMWLQRRLVVGADAVVVLSSHVASQLKVKAMLRPDAKLIVMAHPPFDFGSVPPPLAHGGSPRLLTFGRLLPYKGLDLLAGALHQLGPRADLRLRVVGKGPESPTLQVLRKQQGVSVENRWVPEAEIGELIGWADALVLPYREASQSGVAATALAAGRCVIATRVGGLAEQLEREALARLCEPDATSLAAAIQETLDAPAPLFRPLPLDPAAAWDALAQRLVSELSHLPLGRERPARTSSPTPARRERA
jgi:glycosyltransferase involved in cell wall biosynthesis